MATRRLEDRDEGRSRRWNSLISFGVALSMRTFLTALCFAILGGSAFGVLLGLLGLAEGDRAIASVVLGVLVILVGSVVVARADSSIREKTAVARRLEVRDKTTE